MKSQKSFFFLILYQTSMTTGGLRTRGCALSSWASFSLEAVEKQNLLLPHVSSDWLPFLLYFSERRQQSGKDQRNLLRHQPLFASSFSINHPFPLNLAADNICSKFIVCFPRKWQEQSTSSGTRHNSLWRKFKEANKYEKQCQKVSNNRFSLPIQANFFSSWVSR